MDNVNASENLSQCFCALYQVYREEQMPLVQTWINAGVRHVNKLNKENVHKQVNNERILYGFFMVKYKLQIYCTVIPTFQKPWKITIYQNTFTNCFIISWFSVYFTFSHRRAAHEHSHMERSQSHQKRSD